LAADSAAYNSNLDNLPAGYSQSFFQIYEMIVRPARKIPLSTFMY
jgi:hypothetical protein